MNFVNELSRLNLSLADSTGSKSLASFKEVFIRELGINEESLNTAISSFFHGSLYKKLLQYEFGGHRRLLTDMNGVLAKGFCPVLALIASISDQFKCKVIIACDDLNLAFFSKGSVLSMIRPEVAEREAIIVALTGMGIFRTVLGSGRDQTEALISTIPARSIMALPHVPRDDEPFDYEDEELNSGEESGESVVDVARARSRTTRVPIVHDEEFSIDGFLSEFYNAEAAGGLTVNPEAYTSKCRIDFKGSDVRPSQNRKVSFDKTIDVDGVFAMISPGSLSDSVVSGGRITIPHECKEKRTLKTIKKHLLDTGKILVDKINVASFATIQDSKGFGIFAVASSNKNAINSASSIDIKSLLSRAYSHAETFPCMLESCQHSVEHRLSIAGRSSNHSQIEVETFEWDHNSIGFKCILKAMSEYMLSELSQLSGVNLDFFFKLIGTKFALMTTEFEKVSELLSELGSVFDMRKLAEDRTSSIFVDVCWKFLPNIPGRLDKVKNSCYFILL